MSMEMVISLVGLVVVGIMIRIAFGLVSSAINTKQIHMH